MSKRARKNDGSGEIIDVDSSSSEEENQSLKVDDAVEDDSDDESSDDPTNIDLDFPAGLDEILKPHQKEGVKFIWKNVVIPLEKNSKSRGCIIAHAMGLGKSIQICTFTMMFFEKLKKKHKISDYIEKHGVHPATALIVSPKSTLENWAKEFDMWVKKHNLQNIKNKKKEGKSEEKENSKKNIKKESNIENTKKINQENSIESSKENSIPQRTTALSKRRKVNSKKEQEISEENSIKNSKKEQKSSEEDSDNKNSDNSDEEISDDESSNQTNEEFSDSESEEESESGDSDNEESYKEIEEEEDEEEDDSDAIKVPVYIPSRVSHFSGRKTMIKTWMSKGGVLLLSYPMYTRMVGEIDVAKKKGKINTNQVEFFRKAFTGEHCPQLLIADEGHLIKNAKNASTRALQRVPTPNRILLTGTPVQNKFSELFCMLNFVRPHIWKKEKFKKLFEEPINKGSSRDASSHEVKKMKKATYNLQHVLLKKLVHRKGPEVLQSDLPPKYEYVVKIKMTDYQKTLYNLVLNSKKDKFEEGKYNDYLFSIVDLLRKIINHTDLIKDTTTRRLLDDQEEAEDENVAKKHKENLKELENLLLPYFQEDKYEDGVISDHSTKMKFLMNWIQCCLHRKEKMLVFSQWTSTLDIIEEILEKFPFTDNTGEQFKFNKNSNYFRLDGSSRKRQQMVDNFNDPKGNFQLFLISTNAGGLGLNLTAASRVLLYDVSFNPANDYQACCRAYRYGQSNPVFIYRLVQFGTVEHAIWNRSCAKTWLSRVVVDKKAAKRMLNPNDLDLFDSIDININNNNNNNNNINNNNNNSEISEKILHWKHIIKQDPIMNYFYLNQLEYSVDEVVEHESLFNEDYKDKITEQEIIEGLKEIQNIAFDQTPENDATQGSRNRDDDFGVSGVSYSRKRKDIDFSQIGEKPFDLSSQLGIPKELLSRLPGTLQGVAQTLKIPVEEENKKHKSHLFNSTKKQVIEARQALPVTNNENPVDTIKFLEERRKAIQELEKKKREAKKAIELKKKKQTVNFDVRSELARLNMTPKGTQDIPPKVVPKISNEERDAWLMYNQISNNKDKTSNALPRKPVVTSNVNTVPAKKKQPAFDIDSLLKTIQKKQ